ncbi:DUF2336 domain-containing protein [Tepidamorphus sp. 3E244]|uniref:DUF2336 domain-containing protein n=1 Tax=Tepidamorphus sp. 3E244 TaxID=3385498 RepID=UPI0038FD04CA
MTGNGAIDALMQLAHEGSSDKRRELLHAVTDLFLTSETVTDAQSQMFDQVMTQVAAQAGVEGRRDLADRIAPIGHAPRGIVNQLARDEEISVASPVLKQSTVLSDSDLVEIAEQKGQGHMAAMAERQSINSIVTDVLIRRGNSNVLRNVSGNKGAELSETGARTLSQKAEADAEIQRNLNRRTDLPEAVAEEVKQRNVALDEAERLRVLEGPIARMIPKLVIDFADLSGLEPARIEKMMVEERIDLLVIICKALELNKQTFEGVLRYRGAVAGSQVTDMGPLLEQFNMLPTQAAQRMARFLKVRQTAA